MIDRAGINQLKCPKCGELIPVSETIYHQIEEVARQDVHAEFAQQQSLIAVGPNCIPAVACGSR